MQVIHQTNSAKPYNWQHLQVPIGDTDQCSALHQSVHRDLHRGGAEECEDHAQSAEPATKGHIHSGHASHDDGCSAGGTDCVRSSCSCRWRWRSSSSCTCCGRWRRWRHPSSCHTPVSCPSHSSCNSGWPGERAIIILDRWCLEGVSGFIDICCSKRSKILLQVYG